MHSNVPLQITIDTSTFLPADSAGGVELLSKAGKIKVSSTLESRLELLSAKMIPEIRTTLFGENPNRRFHD